jgi:hypothetical protein
MKSGNRGRHSASPITALGFLFSSIVSEKEFNTQSQLSGKTQKSRCSKTHRAAATKDAELGTGILRTSRIEIDCETEVLSAALM